MWVGLRVGVPGPGLGFTLVFTPLELHCPGPHLFHCGGPGSHCVQGSLACDGRVNCMLPGRQASTAALVSTVHCREAADENPEFCARINRTSNKHAHSETTGGNCICYFK